jgi:hypothetical protein
VAHRLPSHRQVEESYFAQQALLQEYLVVDELLKKKLRDDCKDGKARAYTTKYECLIIKAMLASNKTPEKKKETITKYFTEHAKFARCDPKEYMFKSVYDEAQLALAKK